MSKKVLAFIEQRNNQIKKASLECAKMGAEIAAKYGGSAEAVIIGGDVNSADLIGGYGIKNVTYYKNAGLENYSPSAYNEILANHINESGAEIILIANTAMGKDLAPRLSVKLDCGLAMDCTALELEGDSIKVTRPIYAGKALAEMKITSPKQIFTLRPNVFSAGIASEDKVEVKIAEVASPNLAVKVTEIKKSEGKLDVAEADIIVSGGRGMKGPEHFNLVEDLANLLGAAVGASRAVVDAGWRPHGEQVGQTGKTVSPTLYIALGISGAIQHLAGMRSSKYIVAVNKDKDAPIFQVADYGIAGDVFEVVPALIEEIKKVKS